MIGLQVCSMIEIQTMETLGLHPLRVRCQETTS